MQRRAKDIHINLASRQSSLLPGKFALFRQKESLPLAIRPYPTRLLSGP